MKSDAASSRKNDKQGKMDEGRFGECEEINNRSKMFNACGVEKVRHTFCNAAKANEDGFGDGDFGSVDGSEGGSESGTRKNDGRFDRNARGVVLRFELSANTIFGVRVCREAEHHAQFQQREKMCGPRLVGWFFEKESDGEDSQAGAYDVNSKDSGIQLSGRIVVLRKVGKRYEGELF